MTVGQHKAARPPADDTGTAEPAGRADAEPTKLGLCVFDGEERLVMCNDHYLQIYGLSPDLVKPGMTLPEILRCRAAKESNSFDPDEMAGSILSALRARHSATYTNRLGDGRIVSVVNEPLPNGAWVSTHEDITYRTRVEQELEAARSFLDSVIDNIPICLFVEDPQDFRLQHINSAAADLLGMSREAALNKSAYDLLPKDEADFVTARNREVLQSGTVAILGEHWVHTPHLGPRLMFTKKIPVPGPNGKPQYLLGMAEDVTERKRAEERIAHMAHHDPLTDLPNRAAFTERLMFTIERAEESGNPFAVLCLDFDRFKEVNDVFGHPAGDELLRQVAGRLQAAVEGTFLARLGGDELMLISADGPQPSTAATLADRLLDAVEKEFEIDGNQLHLGISIGVAVFPNDGRDAMTLLGNADAALYRAKVEGRGLIRFFAPEMDEKLRERRALQLDLRSAIERNQLALHYQPQARMDREIVGFEALVRWHHPSRGLIPPNTFIPIAEESGLMLPLGEWVLREACRQAASWKKPLQIAVNLSPVQFRHGDLPALVHSILLESGLAASRLELEITEGVLISDFSRAVSILRRLKSLGVRIAMDDFGTGYSSLAYLQSFPFDKIKIDQAFISNLERNPQSAAIVRAVIGLGRGLDLPVVAEGVETMDQLSFLSRESCDEVQGYFIGRPQPIEHYAELVGGMLAPPTPVARTG
jgi:diguanylate cyclase (GGDEF)-like protein/PAS domain S-box-containing protein